MMKAPLINDVILSFTSSSKHQFLALTVSAGSHSFFCSFWVRAAVLILAMMMMMMCGNISVCVCVCDCLALENSCILVSNQKVYDRNADGCSSFSKELWDTSHWVIVNLNHSLELPAFVPADPGSSWLLRASSGHFRDSKRGAERFISPLAGSPLQLNGVPQDLSHTLGPKARGQCPVCDRTLTLDRLPALTRTHRRWSCVSAAGIDKRW